MVLISTFSNRRDSTQYLSFTKVSLMTLPLCMCNTDVQGASQVTQERPIFWMLKSSAGNLRAVAPNLDKAE